MTWCKRHIHKLILLSCFLGYVWVFINYSFLPTYLSNQSICIFKNITNLPCPSCGITRAIILFLMGNFVGSIEMNPLGVLMLLIIFITPFFVLYDMVKKKELVLKSYQTINNFFSQKKVAIPFFAFVIINWVWNIYKHL